MDNDKKNITRPSEKPFSPADSGNASNPSPHEEGITPDQSNQLIDEKGEKYLKEVASIEDYPDAQDAQDMEEQFDEENSK